MFLVSNPAWVLVVLLSYSVRPNSPVIQHPESWTVKHGLVTAGETCPWIRFWWRKHLSSTLSLETLAIRCVLVLLHGWKPYVNWKNTFLMWFWILWIQGLLVTREKWTIGCKKSLQSTAMTYILKPFCRKGYRCSNNIWFGVVFLAFVSWVISGSRVSLMNFQ